MTSWLQKIGKKYKIFSLTFGLKNIFWSALSITDLRLYYKFPSYYTLNSPSVHITNICTLIELAATPSSVTLNSLPLYLHILKHIDAQTPTQTQTLQTSLHTHVWSKRLMHREQDCTQHPTLSHVRTKTEAEVCYILSGHLLIFFFLFCFLWHFQKAVTPSSFKCPSGM